MPPAEYTPELQRWLIAVIRTRCSNQGISLRQLAAAAQMTPKHLSEMLHGHSMGTLQAWQRLLDASGSPMPF